MPILGRFDRSRTEKNARLPIPAVKGAAIARWIHFCLPLLRPEVQILSTPFMLCLLNFSLNSEIEQKIEDKKMANFFKSYSFLFLIRKLGV